MALFDKDARNTLIGIGVGLGFVAILPLVKPIFKDAGRPLLKASIKGGILAYEKGREVAARWGEIVEDLIVEVRAETEAHPPEPAIPSPNGPMSHGVS